CGSRARALPPADQAYRSEARRAARGDTSSQRRSRHGPGSAAQRRSIGGADQYALRIFADRTLAAATGAGDKPPAPASFGLGVRVATGKGAGPAEAALQYRGSRPAGGSGAPGQGRGKPEDALMRP